MTDGKVRWAVIGAGDIVRKRAGAALLEQPDSTMHACVVRNPEGKKETIDFLGPRRIYTNIDQMAADDEIGRRVRRHAGASPRPAGDRGDGGGQGRPRREANGAQTRPRRSGCAARPKRPEGGWRSAYFRRFSPRFELAKRMLEEGRFGRGGAGSDCRSQLVRRTPRWLARTAGVLRRRRAQRRRRNTSSTSWPGGSAGRAGWWPT